MLYIILYCSSRIVFQLFSVYVPADALLRHALNKKAQVDSHSARYIEYPKLLLFCVIYLGSFFVVHDNQVPRRNKN